MRASVAIVLSIVMLMLGFHALGLQAQQVKPDMNNSTNFTTDTYNMTLTVHEGVGRTLAKSSTWLGVGALVALGLGVVLGSYGGGGR